MTEALMADPRDKRDVRREQVVARLFDAWCDQDGDRIRSFFNEESVFVPAGGDPLKGSEAIAEALSGAATECQLLELATEGDGVVLARWRQRQQLAGRSEERELQAAIAVEGCKVRLWRDCA